LVARATLKYLVPMTASSAPPQERWLLAGTILAASLVFIDGTALNVALPRIQTGLGATASDLLWIVNGYLLVLAALIPLGGALGDRFGRRRVYMLGIAAFLVGSMWCGFAPDPHWMIAARVFQGLGGALLVPGSLALLNAGTAPGRRDRAIGVWSAATTVVTVLGPLVGGLFCDWGWWRAVFFLNVPLGAAALLLLGTRVPDDQPGSSSGKMDWGGSLLLSLGLAALTWGAQSVPGLGFTAPLPWVAIVAGLAALGAFVAAEFRAAHPVIPWNLFASPGFAGANLLTFFLYGALNVLGFFLNLNLVQVQGYPVALAGMAMLPFAVLMAIFSRRFGIWADRVGPRPFLAAGPTLVAIGFLGLGAVGLTPGWTAYFWTFFPGILVFGLGMAVTVAPLSAAVMGSVADDKAGVASGINNAVSRVAGVLALAVLGAVAASLFPGAWAEKTAALPLDADQKAFLLREAAKLAGAALPPGLAPGDAFQVKAALESAFLEGWRVVMVSCAGLALAAGAFGWWGIPGKKR